MICAENGRVGGKRRRNSTTLACVTIPGCVVRREEIPIMWQSLRFRFVRSALTFGAVSLIAGPACAADATKYVVRMQALPGATAAGITMDYIAFDPATRFVWVPAGNTGLVVVVDSTTGALR